MKGFLKNYKEWRTTVMGVIAGVLMIAGLLWPENLDPNKQGILIKGLNEILIGLGTIITLVNGVIAKDK